MGSGRLFVSWYVTLEVILGFQLHRGNAPSGISVLSRVWVSPFRPRRCSTIKAASLLSKEVPESSAGLDDATRNDLKHLVQSHKVLLFMKGTPSLPKCGFSEQAVRILQAIGLDDFSFVDVLDAGNDQIRRDIKLYSDWATIPQLYIGGEFIGGSELIRETFNEGTLKKLIDAVFEGTVEPTYDSSDAPATGTSKP